MTDKPYVLDASAVLAAFFDEPGAAYIAERMDGALISAVNYSEVVAKLVDRGTPSSHILEVMAQFDVEVVPVDQAQAMSAGLLRSATHNAGLSLGDRCCLALALTRDAIALTTDRAWGELDVKVKIELVR